MLELFVVFVLREHRPFDREYRVIRRSDGQVRWVHGLGRLEFDDQENLVRMIGTIQDVTDRKQAEVQLASERNLLDPSWDSLPDSTYIKDRDSHFMLCSRQTLRAAGIENAKQIIGKTDFDFYPPEVATRFFEEERN